MITTFFGAHSFGGDAAYVERLSRALARRGHEVEVIHCADAFATVADGHPLRAYGPADGVRVHTLHSRLGPLSSLWSHQTGRPGPKGASIQRILRDGEFDVVHFHNVSLMGAPRLLETAGAGEGAIRLMTAHEYWLVCPMHTLWKLDRDVCERPQCVRCTLHGRRPPQLWRSTRALEHALESLDALICPSRHAAEAHRTRGIARPIVHLPYFLPSDWAGAATAAEQTSARPYFVAAGRLIKAKGFQDLVPVLEQFPDHDLVIAGTGPFEQELRRAAAQVPNVRLVGLLDPVALRALFRDAVALVVPSLVNETFGYVALEAFSVGTPAIVRRRGALEEIISESGGGITFDTSAEALAAMRRVSSSERVRRRLGEAGRRAVESRWSEEVQLGAYLELIERLRGATAGGRASAGRPSAAA